ncbi:MAG: hypothetical protein IKV79_00375 [Oscillospiraceae bacterium]|nr:hypothetical protein [Oscillospiraceae bacterium]
MSTEKTSKMRIFKKIFFVLLILDIIGLILLGIAMFPTFKTISGYGSFMLVVACIMIAILVIIMLLEILFKAFLIRTTSPTFSWDSPRKGYKRAAKFLIVFNILAAIIGLLSLGGEGATVFNQARIYLNMIVSALEVVTAIFYLIAAKKKTESCKTSN